MTDDLKGGCLCGHIRYHIKGAPLDGFHCHCTICRKSAGAGHQSWSMIPTSNFHVDHGNVKIFPSSEKVIREFCPECGTQILSKFTNDPDHVYISMGSFDDPEKLKPTSHVYADTTVSWDEQDDGLPRFEAMPPE